LRSRLAVEEESGVLREVMTRRLQFREVEIEKKRRKIGLGFQDLFSFFLAML
jgi:hypothetical protein